jgi:2-polyprenyl-3-methyl-5-hydroxy-6-metoxy-1,4-benzoquinol methylase
MEKTGEREYPSKQGSLEGIDEQHLARYRWASKWTKGHRVYDIACGCGYGSLLLKATKYHGIDKSREAIDFAMSNYPETCYDSAPKFTIGDAQELSYELPRKHIVISFETIEHLEDPEPFLIWVRKKAKKFIVSSPIYGSCGMSPFHKYEYTVQQFKLMLDERWPKVAYYLQQGTNITEGVTKTDKGIIIGVCELC